MAEANGLSTAFAEAHPADAARVLETLPAEDTAAFIGALAARLAAPILREMGAPHAARIALLLDDAHVAAVAQFMGPQAAARIVQQLPHERQLTLLARLPVTTAIAIRLLVGYPRGTCGAYMDPWPLALAPHLTAADALEQVRRFEGEIDDCILVSNGDRRLIGVLSLGNLVRAGPYEPLSVLMSPASHTVPALASVALVASHPGWEAFRVLPVVERENRLVGVLHRRALMAALATPAQRPEPNVASGVFAAYWQVVSALTEVAVGALPSVPPVSRRKESDER
jgi:Mg/Co/Ni transporter MgtE